MRLRVQALGGDGGGEWSNPLRVQLSSRVCPAPRGHAASRLPLPVASCELFLGGARDWGQEAGRRRAEVCRSF